MTLAAGQRPTAKPREYKGATQAFLLWLLPCIAERRRDPDAPGLYRTAFFDGEAPPAAPQTAQLAAELGRLYSERRLAADAPKDRGKFALGKKSVIAAMQTNLSITPTAARRLFEECKSEWVGAVPAV